MFGVRYQDQPTTKKRRFRWRLRKPKAAVASQGKLVSQASSASEITVRLQPQLPAELRMLAGGALKGRRRSASAYSHAVPVPAGGRRRTADATPDPGGR